MKVRVPYTQKRSRNEERPKRGVAREARDGQYPIAKRAGLNCGCIQSVRGRNESEEVCQVEMRLPAPRRQMSESSHARTDD